MRNIILKASIVFVMLMLLVVGLSSVSAENDENLQVLTLSKDGISFDYPSDWQSSRALSNYSVMAIAKTNSVDSFGIAKVTINVEKKPLEGDFATFVNNTYKSMAKDSKFELVSSGGIVIDNHDAVEYIYTSIDDSGNQKEHKAVWFEKDSQAYVLLYSAPLNDFESNLYVYDYILSDIKIS